MHSYPDDDPYGEFKRRYADTTRALTEMPGMMVGADTVARAVDTGRQGQKPQTPLYRRGVRQGLCARASAADRPDVGPGHDEGPEGLVSNTAAPQHSRVRSRFSRGFTGQTTWARSWPRCPPRSAGRRPPPGGWRRRRLRVRRNPQTYSRSRTVLSRDRSRRYRVKGTRRSVQEGQISGVGEIPALVTEGRQFGIDVGQVRADRCQLCRGQVEHPGLQQCYGILGSGLASHC